MYQVSIRQSRTRRLIHNNQIRMRSNRRTRKSRTGTIRIYIMKYLLAFLAGAYFGAYPESVISTAEDISLALSVWINGFEFH